MGVIDSFKQHLKTKKIEKQKMKEREVKLRIESKEDDRMKELLHIYFDNHGHGLLEEQIEEINDYIKTNVVLNDEHEINSFTTLLLTYLTIAKRKFVELQSEIKERVDAGEIISKADAALIAENIVINKPTIESIKVINGKQQFAEISPAKVYTLNIALDSPQPIITKKYQDESDDKKHEIDRTIERYSNVEALACNLRTDKTM